METLMQDLRYAGRAFRRAPGFAIAAVLTLGLGIGATTSIFSVVNGVLLKALPYPDSERLVALRSNQSALNLEDVLTWSRSYANGGGYAIQALDLVGGREPVQVPGALVTGGLLPTLGVKAALGRTIRADDDRFGGEWVAVVTDGFWRQRLGGDPNAVGRPLRLSGQSFTLIGVMPKGFELPRSDAEVFVPLKVAYPVAAKFRGVNFLRTTLRLAPGVSVTQAREEMVAIGRRLARETPEENAQRNWEMFTLLDRMVGGVRRTLWILLGSVTLVLLVACSNFANLLLTRAASRSQELAVRSSLGAGRGRLVRQMITESLLLAVVGGALGVLMSQWAVDLLAALAPENLPRLGDVAIDARVLGFALALAGVTGVVFGLLPALQAARGAEAEALKRGAATVTRGGDHRLLGGLVVAQIAFALVLLAGAGLLVNAFVRLNAVEPGFDPHHLLTFRVEMPEARYTEIEPQIRFRDRMLEAFGGIPGASVALVSELPLTNDALMHNVIVADRPPVTPGQEPELFSRSVAGDYFAVMRIPIVAGRALGTEDRAGAPLVGVINQSMARTYFPGENPLGKRVRWARFEGPPQWITIVGVAGNVKHFGLGQDDEPAIYTPYAQFGSNWKRWTQVIVRTPGDPEALIAPVKARMAAIDPEVPLTRVRSMDAVVASSVDALRFNLILIGVFALVAIVLAGIGVFGVTSYAATRRTRELGLRMVLGATRSDIGWLVLRRGLALAGLGIVIGAAGALAATRLLTSMLYEVRPNDPATFAAVALSLGIVSCVACVIPAVRASRVEPVIALRTE